MKEKLILFVVMLACGVWVRAQDPVPKLIVSEIYMYHTEEAYVELTNMGDQSVDLSRVIFAAAQSDQGYRTDTTRWNVQMLSNAGLLGPGESFVVMNYRTSTSDSTNIFTPSWYFGIPDYWLQYTKRGSISGMRFTNGDDAFGLFWDKDGDKNVDYAIDTLLDEVGYPGEAVTFNVAGVTNASLTHTFVRKANVAKGNGGDFFTSAGVSSEDSEWIAIPYDPYRLGSVFTTVGNHGNSFSWDFTPLSGTIDDNGISIPWGTWRDSVFKAFDIGPNMAWHLIWGADTLQSNAIQTGDTLLVYLCGNEAEVRRYPITVTDALESNNIVIPKLNLSNSGTPILVTNGDPVIDTVYSIPYGTRSDTVFAYLEKASNATWEIEAFDGAIRAEVKTGDKLIVTAANGDKKEYYILTDEYSPSDNAYLETILIDNDTLWGFSRNTDVYNIILSPDAQKFPSISVTTESNDARATIKHPTFIRGSEEERTATIEVVAESDTITFTYSIIFDFARSIQRNELEPFFSQVLCGNSRGESGFEIFNPSNVPISLADYLMVRARPDGGAPISSLEDALALRDSSDFDYFLNFGYYYDNSRSGEGMFFKEATNYNIDIEPFNVWFIKRDNTSNWGGPDNADFYCFKEDQPLYYDSNDGSNVGYWFLGYSYWLLKMENDSILDGLKSADDPDDWRFVDVFGTVGDRFDHSLTIDGYPLEYDADQHLIRKGHIHKGNPEPYGSIREDDGPGSSEWYVVGGEEWTGPLNDVGRHSGFIKPTDYISTIKSAVYLVSLGISNNESIDGVFPGSTVTQFYEKLIKADPDQLLKVIAADGSGELELTDAVTTGDTLVVQSKDLENTTKYVITTGFLSNNALLTSATYDIAVTGVNGTISTVEHLTTINELLADITIPSGAFMNIYDHQGRHVPLLHLAPDTLIEIDPVVSDSIFIEVIAQDGITKIEYSLVMAALDEPYITSNVYLVDQENKVIDLFVDNTNIKTFLSHVRPSSGANISVYDKFDYERTEANMFIDDKVVVKDQNEVSVTYTLKGFFDREEIVDTTGTDTTYIEQTIAGAFSNVRLYPNPARSVITMDGIPIGSKVVIMNLYGEAIAIREASTDLMEIDLNNYTSGIYFVRVVKEGKFKTYKFLRQ